jgi:hypothetical protein
MSGIRDRRCICYPWHLSVVVHADSASIVEGSSSGAQEQSGTADGGILLGSYPCGLACIVQAIPCSIVGGSNAGKRM